MSTVAAGGVLSVSAFALYEMVKLILADPAIVHDALTLGRAGLAHPATPATGLGPPPPHPRQDSGARPPSVRAPSAPDCDEPDPSEAALDGRAPRAEARAEARPVRLDWEWARAGFSTALARTEGEAETYRPRAGDSAKIRVVLRIFGAQTGFAFGALLSPLRVLGHTADPRRLPRRAQARCRCGLG